MTMLTYWFNTAKENGYIKKRPHKASFSNGLKHMERTRYYDTRDEKEYVILNGNVIPFYPYPDEWQRYKDCVVGHI